MHQLPRLAGRPLLGLLMGILLFTAACETSRTGESADPVRAAQRRSGPNGPSAAQAIAQVNGSGPPSLRMAEAELKAAFAQQFGDGTVVNNILVRSAPAAPKEETTFYLVGMGQHDGSTRAMALPLRDSGSGLLYLAPHAERYVLTSPDCPTCIFKFAGPRIVGTTCGDGSASTCTLQVLEDNALLGSE